MDQFDYGKFYSAQGVKTAHTVHLILSSLISSLLSKLDNEKESPLPLQPEGERLSRDILSEFPTVGTVLRVKVAGRKAELDSSSLIVGKWVKLMDLAFEVHAGVCYCMFTPCTKLRYVLDEDRRISKCLSNSKERFLSKWDRMPFTSIPWPPLVTETEAEDVSLVTLMDIINYSQEVLFDGYPGNDEVTHKRNKYWE